MGLEGRTRVCGAGRLSWGEWGWEVELACVELGGRTGLGGAGR